MTKEKKGLVMEVNLKQVILLRPTGDFVAVKLKKGDVVPSVGQEYSISLKKGAISCKIVSFATLIAVLFVFTLLPAAKNLFPLNFYLSSQLESYLVIDINPSLELGLDKSQIVRTAKALNQDGEIILQKEEIVGIPVGMALNKVINAAIKLGYLTRENTGQNLLVTYVPLKNQEVAAETKEELTAEITKSLVEKKVTANVEAVIANENMREAAQRIGLSTGKYAVLLGAKEKGIDLSPEDLQKDNLTAVVNKCGTNLKELLEGVQKYQNSSKESRKETGQENNLQEKSVKNKKDKNKNDNRKAKLVNMGKIKNVNEQEYLKEIVEEKLKKDKKKEIKKEDKLEAEKEDKDSKRKRRKNQVKEDRKDNKIEKKFKNYQVIEKSLSGTE